MENSSFSKCNTLPDEVQVNFDMLCPLMLHRVGGEVNCTDVVAEDDSCLTGRSMKLKKKLTQPT